MRQRSAAHRSAPSACSAASARVMEPATTARSPWYCHDGIGRVRRGQERDVQTRSRQPDPTSLVRHVAVDRFRSGELHALDAGAPRKREEQAARARAERGLRDVGGPRHRLRAGGRPAEVCAGAQRVADRHARARLALAGRRVVLLDRLEHAIHGRRSPTALAAIIETAGGYFTSGSGQRSRSCCSSAHGSMPPLGEVAVPRPPADTSPID